MALITGIVFSTLLLSLIAFPLSATAQGPDSTPDKVQVVSALGKIPGKDLIVHVWVVVPPGADKNEVANEALRNQGARPFTPEEFSTISLFWDRFSDGDPGNDFVTQNYNPVDDPTNDQGKIALLKTHDTWNGVASSSFNFTSGPDTFRCPSLVRECDGPSTFDGYNDVAWLVVRGNGILGVAWSGTSIDEVDIALNTQFNWNTNGNDFDVETVFLHENGHALGLGHSNVVGAVMEPVYDGVRRSLDSDDIAGITFLYPVDTIESPALSVTISTDAPSYVDGDEVSIPVLVTDGTSPMGGVSVHVDLDTANDSPLSGNGITDANGVALFTYTVDTGSHGIGTYNLSTTASKTGYVSGTDSTTFEVTSPSETGGDTVTVTGISEAEIVKGTTIGVTITGSGFLSGASVTFENGCGPSPSASDVSVDSPASISANITAKNGGPPRSCTFDVRVTNGDGSTDVLPNGLTVILP